MHLLCWQCGAFFPKMSGGCWVQGFRFYSWGSWLALEAQASMWTTCTGICWGYQKHFRHLLCTAPPLFSPTTQQKVHLPQAEQTQTHTHRHTHTQTHTHTYTLETQMSNFHSPLAKKTIGFLCFNLRILTPTGLSTLGSPWRVSLMGKRLRGGLFGYYMAKTTSIWPHELFSAIFQFHREAFDKYILGGGPEAVRAFWNRMPPRNGTTNKPNWRERMVPISLHGDGVSVSNVRGKGSKTVDTLSWSSLLSSAPSRLSMFLIWLCYSHVVKTDGMAPTWASFWRKLTASFQALFEGVWPHVDMNGAPDPKGGQELAGGYYASLYVVKGDLEWMSKHFSLLILLQDSPAHCVLAPTLARRMSAIHGLMWMTLLHGCPPVEQMRLVFLCGLWGSKSLCLSHCFCPFAHNKSTECPESWQMQETLGHALHSCCPCIKAFLEEHPHAHPVLQPRVIPGGGLTLFVPDWMHTKSLGVDANLLGSCIAYLAKVSLPGSVDANIALLWDGIQEQYRSQKVGGRLGRLTINMVKKWPFS